MEAEGRRALIPLEMIFNSLEEGEKMDFLSDVKKMAEDEKAKLINYLNALEEAEEEEELTKYENDEKQERISQLKKKISEL